MHHTHAQQAGGEFVLHTVAEMCIRDRITEEFKELRLAGINMVSSMEELYRTDFANYCALFLGGGNTYRLLAGLKASGCFEKRCV